MKEVIYKPTRFTRKQSLFIELFSILSEIELTEKDRDKIDDWLQKAMCYKEGSVSAEKRRLEVAEERLEKIKDDVINLEKFLLKVGYERKEAEDIAGKRRKGLRLIVYGKEID